MNGSYIYEYSLGGKLKGRQHMQMALIKLRWKQKMKNTFKKLIPVTVTITIILVLIGASIAAYQYLNFEGDQQIEQAGNDVDEVMQIMRQLNDKNITLEEALKQLQDMNPAGLAKQNKELREQVKQLENEIVEKNAAYDELQKERDQIATVRDNAIAERDNLQAQYNTLNDGYNQLQNELTAANEYIDHLEAELTRANEAVTNHAEKTGAAVEEARTYK